MIAPSTASSSISSTFISNKQITTPLQENNVMLNNNNNNNVFQPPRKKQRVQMHEVESDGSEFICKANSVMRIQFLTNINGFDDSDDDSDDEGENGVIQSFSPEFTHQFFGDSETIVGFKNLKLRLFYTPSGANSFFHMSFDDRLLAIGADPEKDTPEAKLNEKYGLPPKYTKQRDVFRQALANEINNGSYLPPGTKIETFSNKFGTFEIYRSSPSESKEAKEQHERLETLALYMIDGASPVDLDDHRWRVYTTYQLLANNKASTDENSSNSSMRKFVAYLTALEFTNPFRAQRQKALRVCQIITVPTNQRQGHGSKLLQHVTNDVRNENMFEVTFEDPSNILTRMRQVNDIIACKKNSIFLFATNKGADNTNNNSSHGNSFPPLPLDWKINSNYVDQVQKSLRITKKQIIFSYEVLKFEAMLIATGGNKSNEFMVKYQDEIKGKLEKLHKYDLDQIKNSEGVKNEEQYQIALQILYQNQMTYFQNVISIVTKQFKKN